MDKMKDIHISVQKRRTLCDSEESELDESWVIEERLTSLISSKRRNLRKTRNIFEDFQEKLPTLRRSIVSRALANIVSSTPMVRGRKSAFFKSEESVNISPIATISSSFGKRQNNRDKFIKKNEEKKPIRMSEMNLYYISPDEAFVTIINKNQENQTPGCTHSSKTIVDSMFEASKSESRTNLSNKSEFESVKICRNVSAPKKVNIEKSFSNLAETKIEKDLTQSNQLSKSMCFKENSTSADLGYPDSLNSVTAIGSRSQSNRSEKNTMTESESTSSTIKRKPTKSQCQNMDKRDNRNSKTNQLRFSETSSLDQIDGVSNNVSGNSVKILPEVSPITSLPDQILDSTNSKLYCRKGGVNDTSKIDSNQEEMFDSGSGTLENNVVNCFEEIFSSESPSRNKNIISSNISSRLDNSDQITPLKSSETIGRSVVKVDERKKRYALRERKINSKERIHRKGVDNNDNDIEKTNSSGCGTIVSDNIGIKNQDELIFKVGEKPGKAVNKKYEKKIDNSENQQDKVMVSEMDISSRSGARKRYITARDVQSQSEPSGSKSLKPNVKDNGKIGLVMEDSDKPIALRRSARLRRPPVRRICYGVVVTYSEKVFIYYNGSSQKPTGELCLLNVQKASKPRSKKKNITRNKPDGKENRDPENNKNRLNGKKGEKSH